MSERRQPISTRRAYAFFQPYIKGLAGLIAVTLLLTLWTGAVQVALTPLAGIIISGEETVAQIEQPGTIPCSLDLDTLSTCVLDRLARLTGFSDQWRLLLVASGGYLVLALTGQTMAVAARYWGERIRADINRDIGDQMFAHLLRLPMRTLNDYPVGWLQSRLTMDIAKSTELLNKFIIDGLGNVLLTAFYAALLIRTDIRLTAVAAVAGGLHMLFSRRMSKWMSRTIFADLDAAADVQAAIQERLSAIREVKALAAESFERSRLYQLLDTWAESVLAQHMTVRVEIPIRWSINRLVIISVMLFGAWLTINGELSTEAFLLYLFFAQNLIAPLAKLASVLVGIAAIRTSLAEVAALLDMPAEPSGTRPVTSFDDVIRLEGVTFAYVEGLPVLRDIDLTVRKGEMVALVGQSGSGKTSLVDLILRFFQPDEGTITLDGVSITDYDLAGYRRLFGVVSQESVLLDETVATNIAYARPDLTREQIERAAWVANAADFIEDDLPLGYDTVLGERGVLLSGGQRQRIAIARAVAHQPPILVLDEATSALDSEAERKVQAAIDEVVQGSTAIVIAHRLSTVRRADKIVVLRAGRIVEQGTHRDLLALGGEYAHLHNQQFTTEE